MGRSDRVSVNKYQTLLIRGPEAVRVTSQVLSQLQQVFIKVVELHLGRLKQVVWLG